MKLFAALREDMQQGWVWLLDPSLPARSIIKITHPVNRKSIYCETLQMETNFLAAYNQSPRITINNPQSAIVINDWYRTNLGGLATQEDVSLTIEPCNSLYGRFVACIHHPQAVVRVAAWLGLISIILGFVGLVLGVMSIYLAS